MRASFMGSYSVKDQGKWKEVLREDVVALLLGEDTSAPPTDQETHEEPWVDCLAVVSGSFASGNVEVVFVGSRDECIGFMRTHSQGEEWDDLFYAKMRPKAGGGENEMEVDLMGLSSWGFSGARAD